MLVLVYEILCEKKGKLIKLRMEINGEAFEYDTHCVLHTYAYILQVIVHDHNKYYGVTRELKKTKTDHFNDLMMYSILVYLRNAQCVLQLRRDNAQLKCKTFSFILG